MARIRVLEILEAAGGGALKHVSQIAEHLDKTEFDLTVAVSPVRMRRPDREVPRLRALGVRVEVIPMKRRPAPLADLRALRSLSRLISRNRYDVVHAHSSKAGILGGAVGVIVGLFVFPPLGVFVAPMATVPLLQLAARRGTAAPAWGGVAILLAIATLAGGGTPILLD